MKTEIIEAEEYSESAHSAETTLTTLADKPASQVRVPRGVSRADVVNAFQQSFEMIGGVPRLAQWAGDNPAEFYKLYAKLLPSASSAQLDDSKETVVLHVLPRSALDE